MTRTFTWYQTTVGKKAILAVTGLILFAYLFAHLLGNLQIYAGAAAINGYAAFLHSQPLILWGARVVLVVAVGWHIWVSIQLALDNQGARAGGYREKKHRKTTYAARTMLWSGPIVATFIIYHLLHLTAGAVGPPFAEHDVYANIVAGFSIWYIAVFYIVAMVLLGFHLHHGVWSFFQTLGLSHPKWNGARRKFATGFTYFIVLGNISIPIAVLTGIVS